MPWRRKPTSRLRYWSGGSPAKARADGFTTILVYCVGPPDRDPRPRCWHWSAVKLDDLPEWDWYDICAHLKCTQCGAVGWVDPRPNWSEIINFNKGVGFEAAGLFPGRLERFSRQLLRNRLCSNSTLHWLEVRRFVG